MAKRFPVLWRLMPETLSGGVGGNIAWSLGLLGEPSMLVGSVGEDFAAELEVGHAGFRIGVGDDRGRLARA